MTYSDVLILESLCENANDGILVLLLNDTGGGCEDSESSLSKTRIGRLAGLEQDTKQLGPLVAYKSRPKIQRLELMQKSWCFKAVGRSSVPLSVYWRATSATASPIFLRTSVTDSVVRHETSFSRIATRCSIGKQRKTSLASPETGSLRVLVEILRKSTAEKARVCL